MSKVKGETLMEHETVERVIGTKRILIGIVGGGAAASLLSAALRVAVSPCEDNSLNGLLGLGIILGPFPFRCWRSIRVCEWNLRETSKRLFAVSNSNNAIETFP